MATVGSVGRRLGRAARAAHVDGRVLVVGLGEEAARGVTTALDGLVGAASVVAISAPTVGGVEEVEGPAPRQASAEGAPSPEGLAGTDTCEGVSRAARFVIAGGRTRSVSAMATTA